MGRHAWDVCLRSKYVLFWVHLQQLSKISAPDTSQNNKTCLADGKINSNGQIKLESFNASAVFINTNFYVSNMIHCEPAEPIYTLTGNLNLGTLMKCDKLDTKIMA